MFTFGKIYNRRDLHQIYGGQRQGGISTPSKHNFLLLFTGEQGNKYGYKDQWIEDGLFLYTGEGQHGDMEFVRGNLAIQNHASDGKDLHLFEYVKKGGVRYIGQMVCTGHQERRAPDSEGNDRRVIVFELTPINAFEKPVEEEKFPEETGLWQTSLSSLREKALASSTVGISPSERKNLIQYRSNAIRVYALRRANGSCEACKKEAPFITKAGQPYLEPHHIRRLSDGGPDHPEWVITLCPNCHRRAHYGNDSEVFNQGLTVLVARKEKGPDFSTQIGDTR